MVELENTSFNYNKDSGIFDINLKIKDGEFCFLVGPTGSGKSSLLKLIYFDLIPDDGNVKVLGFSSKNLGLSEKT